MFDGTRERLAYCVDIWFTPISIAFRITFLELRFDVRFFAGMDDPHNIWIARQVEQHGKRDCVQFMLPFGLFRYRPQAFGVPHERNCGASARGKVISNQIECATCRPQTLRE